MLTFLSTVEICLSTILKGLSKYRVTDGDKMKTDSIKNLYLKVPTPTFTYFWGYKERTKFTRSLIEILRPTR